MSNVISFPKRKKEKDDNYEMLVMRKEHLKKVNAVFETENDNSTSSLFSGMSNMTSSKHTPEIRNCFLSFYNSPCPETWRGVRNKLIDYHTTSWQLWMKYDSNAPLMLSSKEDEEKYPDPQEFAEYYEKYKLQRIEDNNARLEEIQEALKEYD